MHTSTDRSPPLPERRVLHLTISFERGGRRDAILTLARFGRQENIKSCLGTLRGQPEDYAPFTAEFASTRRLGIDGLPSYRDLIRLRDWCRENRIEVVHAHDAASQFVASALRCVAGPRHIIMTFHRSIGMESAHWRDKVRNAVSLLLVDRVLTASRERRHHFISENLIPKHKVITIPLGIDLDRFTPDSAARAAIRAEFGLAPDELLVVSAGHYGTEKGLDIALGVSAAAAGRLAGRVRFHHLHIGTGTPERIEEMTQVAGLPAARQVTLAGQRPDPERCFAAADILLHTPRLEAFGLVVVQAMACGTPVVGTAVGGIPEMVMDGSTGLLAEPTDRLALTLVLARILGSKTEREEMAAKALERARTEFDATIFVRRHRMLYDSLVGPSAGSPERPENP